MFTGLVQKVGELVELKKVSGGTSMTIAHDAWESVLVPGESVAVQGACLTVSSCSKTQFQCDILEETLARTNFSLKRKGARLNLERAMQTGDRFGGHMVSGHIDGVGRLTSRIKKNRDWLLRIDCVEEISSGMIEKGSVACDGVSLTITAVSKRYFEVSIIPHTWDNTSFAGMNMGETVNIETDLVGKYIRKYLEAYKSGVESKLDMDDLEDAGLTN